MKVASAGSVLIMTLVFFAIFVVIMMAWLGFANRQNHAVVGQEQEEQSFHVSEAGVNYVVHALNSEVCTADELNASQPVRQTVADESAGGDGGEIGTYELTFQIVSPTQVAVRALGYDKNVPSECQLIEATIQSFEGRLGTKYRIQSWDHKSTIDCGIPGPLADPACSS